MMNEPKEQKVILSLVSDLIFAVYIENVAQRLGYRVRTIESAKLPTRAGGLEGDPGVEKILDDLHPALILIDLSDARLAWQEWIAAAKNQPAATRIPVVCFGPHVDARLLEAARQAGAEAALARSRIKKDLPKIIQKYALKDVSHGA